MLFISSFKHHIQDATSASRAVNKDEKSGAVLTPPSTSTDRLLDLDSVLTRLNGQVKAEWYQFGVAIGLPIEFLESLKSYHHVECMVELVDYWLNNHPDQPTWKEIADALEEIQEHGLTE